MMIIYKVYILSIITGEMGKLVDENSVISLTGRVLHNVSLENEPLFQLKTCNIPFHDYMYIERLYHIP